MLIKTFSHFLLLDTFISAITRLVILQFFVEAFYDQSLCNSRWDPTQSPRNYRHGIITSVKYHEVYLREKRHQKDCRVGLGAVQCVLISLLICLTAAQGTLAMTMRRFGKVIENRSGCSLVAGNVRGSLRPQPTEPEKVRVWLQ